MEEAASNETQKARQLEERVKELSATVEELRSQLAWFRRNMFGRKSEQMPTVSAPNAGQFTPAAYAALRAQGAPLAAVA